MELPKVLTTAQVARMLSTESDPWDARMARRRLMGSGALVKVSGRWVTTPAMLMESAGPYGQESLFASFGSREL